MAPRIADQDFAHLGLEQIVQPRCPGAFFPGDMQLSAQTVDELQDAAGWGFDNGFHHLLATVMEDGDQHSPSAAQ